MNFYGMKLRLRVPEGEIRRGVSASGESWIQRMPHAYACIEGSVGVDGKPIDVILGEYATYSKVFVASMPKIYGGEDKLLIGFLSNRDAKNAFLNCYAGDAKFLASMSQMSAKQLKKFIKEKPGQSISAMLYQGQNLSWTLVEHLDQSSNYKDPKDKYQSPEDQRFATELARRAHGQPQMPYTSPGADIAVMNHDFYSSHERKQK